MLGSYTNRLQATKDKEEAVGHPHEDCTCDIVKLRCLPPGAPSGAELLFVHFYYEGDRSKTFRVRMYALTEEEGAINLRIFFFEDEKPFMQPTFNPAVAEFDHLAVRDSGCHVTWVREAGGAESGIDCVHFLEQFVKGDLAAPRFIGKGNHEIPSKRSGRIIRVVEELCLTSRQLLLNDTGFDKETGTVVYGNAARIPYIMVKQACGPQ
eukprot:jgi/Mesvir1/17974/Mv09865-RA.1